MIQTTAQFGGLPNDDLNAHIVNFLEICDTFKANGVTDDAIRLRLFPFSLRNKAKSWLNSLLAGSINTWDDLAQNFLAKFFPLAKSAMMRNDITSFMQFDSESLYEAWERYKDLMRRCPHHGLPKWLQVQTFYNGLLRPFRTTIDAAARGALMRHSNDNCPIYSESCQFVENRQQNNPYSNTYNLGWRNHPNFSWNNNQGSSSAAKSNFPPGFPSRDPMPEKKPSMEDMFMQFMTKTDAFMTKTDASIQN
ncbi:Retrotransposon gag domain - like 10 [Theobroma cacao]|nr:Retrotransposon gag domain - like 10 [Theobroma cacao]